MEISSLLANCWKRISLAGRKWPGEVLKLAMLMTHYREPIDFSVSRLEEALVTRESWLGEDTLRGKPEAGEVPDSIIATLSDDLNFTKCKTVIAEMVKWRKSPDNNNPQKTANDLAAVMVWLGLARDEDFDGARQQSQAQRNILKAKEAGLDLQDIELQISTRLEHIGNQDWDAADTIRQTLLNNNVQLKDSKDAKTGRTYYNMGIETVIHSSELHDLPVSDLGNENVTTKN